MATKAVTINYVDPALNRPDLQIFNSPGGSNGQVQLNTGNRFGSTSNLVWSNSNQTLSLLGNLRVIGNITGTYNTNVQNFKIQGGRPGDILVTTGNGNLSWSNISAATYGNANVAAYLPTYTGSLANSSVSTISNTAPSANVSGKIWYNADDGRAYVSYSNAWVDMNPVVLTNPDLNANTVTFPTGRIQTSSSVQTSPPTASIGSSADKQGDTAVDNTYFYYCYADYDGVSNIWRRVTWSGTTW
jgi:hypothetical protein